MATENSEKNITYQPTLVIGLGGTGKKIITALKKMIAENSRNGMADFPFLKLLSIDTDENLTDANRNSSIKAIKKDELSLNVNEFYPLNCGFTTAPNLDENHYQKIKEWFPESLTNNLIPSELSKGAGQRKPIGRFSFAWNIKKIYDKIKPFLANPISQDVALNLQGKIDTKTTNVFICGSVCGGTGAGSFLDTAYLVRHIASELSGTCPKPKIYGLFATSSFLSGASATSFVNSNCYASLIELDHFMNKRNYQNKNRILKPAYGDYFDKDYSNSSNQKPFDAPFIFEKTGSNGISLKNLDAFYEMGARFIYLLTGHEVADAWDSMMSNAMATLPQNVKKPIEYLSMGAFSILYPKRMIVQLCACKLSAEYFNRILDDSYAPQEIENLVDRFLSTEKLNPKNSQLEERFSKFVEDGHEVNFAEYIDSLIDEFDSEIPKNELVSELRKFEKEIDQKISNFKHLNMTKSRQLREEFLAKFENYLSDIIDLKERKDEANLIQGEPKVVRGSIVRARKICENLINLFTEKSEFYRKQEDQSLSQISSLKNDFNLSLDDLEEEVNKLFCSKRHLEEAKTNVFNSLRDLCNAKKNSYVYDWIRELFNEISENGVPKYSGLIKEIEDYKKIYQGAEKYFSEVQAELVKFLENNKKYDPNALCDVIFDYEKDVEAEYKKLISEKEDYIFTDLSDKLKQNDNFGKYYEKTKSMTGETISVSVITCSESYFFDRINKLNIAERIFDDEDILNKFKSGSYLRNASGVYVGLDDNALRKENLSLEGNDFYAITIPDEYQGKDCQNIKGSATENSGKEPRCPMDEDPDKLRKNPCPMYDKCLRQILMNSASDNLSVIPTSETSDINILHTRVGFPLNAISSVMHNCKNEYYQKRKEFIHDENSEEINMFGPVRFDDLDEETIDYADKKVLAEFKKKLFIAFICNRLKIEAAKVSFITEKDIQRKQTDRPSFDLGIDMADVLNHFQSFEIKYQKMMKQVEFEIDKMISIIKTNSTTKEKIIVAAKKCYDLWCQELPKGLDRTIDLDLFEKMASEILEIELTDKERNTGSDLFSFIIK